MRPTAERTGPAARAGFTENDSLITLALTIFAGLVTVGAAALAAGLAQADAEPDLRTPAAIGGARGPGSGVRRRLSRLQCRMIAAMIAAMGVVLGAVAGIVPAVGLRRAEQHMRWRDYHQALDSGSIGGHVDTPHVPIVLPWGSLGLLIFAVPRAAALLAALVTRSHAQTARRAES